MKNTIFAAAFAAFAVQTYAADLELSLQAYTFRDRSFVETVETAARLGYRNLESYPGQRLGGGMSGSTDYNSIKPEELAKLKAYLAKAPVKVVSYGVTGANGEAQWRKLVAFCKELGIGLVLVEVGINPENLKLGARIAGAAGIKIGLHNHRQPAGRPEEVLKTFNALAGERLAVGASCDIGHWQNSGVDPVEGVKLLKGRFFSIHAIDASGPKAGNKDVALGSGVMDLVSIMNELKKNEKDTVYITVEDEWQHDDLESAVAASARWFNAWKRGELAADGRIRADAIAGLWKDVNAASPAGWDAKALGLVDDIAQRVSQMRAVGLEKSSFKSDEKGMASNENVDAAFAGEGRKFCRPWKGKGYISCDTTFLVAANYYTVGSANDDPARDPVSWVLYGSKDGGAWVELDRRDNVKFTMRHQLRGFQIKNPQMSRTYKIVFHKNNGGDLIQFSRVAFYE